MAQVQHSSLTDPNIHEPKGASTASVDTTYVSNGSGSGTWKKVDSDGINESDIQAWIEESLDGQDIEFTGKFYLTTVIADVSTSSSILVPIVDSCTLIGARLVLAGTITDADATVTFVNASAASLGTGVTVAYSGSDEGTGFNFTSTTNSALTGPTYIKISTDGGSTGTVPLYITLEFEQVLNADV